MSTLNTTTLATRPTTLNNTTDVGKSYFETDSKKILVWDGTAFNEWNKDTTVTPGYNNTYSAYFDGTGDYAQLSSAITLSGACTISGWFRCDSSAQSTMVLLGEISSGDIVLYMNGSNLSMQGFGGAQTTSGVTIARDGTTWYHFAVIRDASNNVDMYIDGVSRKSYTGTSTASLEYFGGDFPKYPNSLWNGYIDEVAIWYSDQTSNLNTIYNSSLGTPDDLSTLSPDHWWRMGESSGGLGSTINDVGYNSSKKHMTLNNAVISPTVPS